MINEIDPPESLAYHVGLSKKREMVISSHFMHKISQNPSLHLYKNRYFQSKRLVINREFVIEELIPILKSACADFCEKRATAAKRRALSRYKSFGYDTEQMIGASEIITEALLDKEFSRNGEKYNSRHELNEKVRRMIDEKGAIEMTMPALPFKIPSPLKSRGDAPDLGEINFLLSVYEIARTLEIICQKEACSETGIQVRFAIVSDGSRFDDIVNESGNTLRMYQDKLAGWITLLGVEAYIQLIDYRLLLRDKLPKKIFDSKLELFRQAHASYTKALWPVFDPDDMVASFEAARQVELDPEYGNAEGRFFSLFKSLVYTVKYKALQELSFCSDDQRSVIYRELTAHLFQPYDSDAAAAAMPMWTDAVNEAGIDLSLEVKERLRKAMLAEAWGAAINYISEIKSDRDLAEDPILTCLPEYLRWTIHAKQGQLAIATPPILGMSVQPWAGSAVFRLTSKGGIRLCTLPSLILEGASAIPVVVEENGGSGAYSQPLFYLDKDLGIADVADLLPLLRDSYTRQRFS
ncbi:L-tyrosine/L-tryptophan isonitrile synthase family protein [Massilia pseudoviolaceinigra]|uniref:L-tyrosine/L-tryptophan isonitrile synthase family protein n=1 Tax=Massilia pseudoviolaceinigra TaxID=3057165 RepID=UPI0027964FAF|nr:L-tyrosine/L-tryptophan isonitrile synthase family protein [Massilia sp. CCM 9206]MDQ1920921.1 L-tyrosine/L-tryptophan isonitrile synthase family protein [Massilia sp. CCM 9206]